MLSHVSTGDVSVGRYQNDVIRHVLITPIFLNRKVFRVNRVNYLLKDFTRLSW